MSTSSPTQPKVSTPRRGKATPNRPATKRAKAASSRDTDALRLAQEQAVHEALHVAADLPSLSDAVRRVLEANVRRRLQRDVEVVFDAFELTFEDQSHASDAYAMLHLTASFNAATVEGAPYLGDTELLEGLPPQPHWASSQFTRSVFRMDPPVKATFYLKRDKKAHDVRFEMFELTVEQLRAAATAWEATKRALVAQGQIRLEKGSSSEAKVFAKLKSLEQHHDDLTQQLQELEVELREVRQRVQEIRGKLARNLGDKPPAALRMLNELRLQLGLALAS